MSPRMRHGSALRRNVKEMVVDIHRWWYMIANQVPAHNKARDNSLFAATTTRSP